jgi:type VI secretion system protein ImpC
MPDAIQPQEGSTTPAPIVAAAAVPAEGGLLDRIVSETRMARDQAQTAYAKDLVSEFVGQVLDQGMTVSWDTVASIKDRIAQIDALLSAQVNEILHNSAFQTLEASWRGLSYLVQSTETGPMLKLRLLNVTKKEIGTDMEKAPEFDQSVLFKRVYEDEYGTFGGNPYSILVGDFEFGRNAQDIRTLELLSNVAAAAHAPFISSASPKLFDWDSFTEMNGPRDLSKGFESAELVKWRSFRDSEDSRYVALTVPHVLMRGPYEEGQIEGINFVEDVNGTDHAKYLWGNSAYALAARITHAFALYKWCAAIRGVEGGGLVEGLPAHTFKTSDGDVVLKCPTEIAITDRREKELNDLGFISLVHCKGTDYAAFFGGQTTNKPKLYNTNEANANSRISGMLPYILAASRFAHYIKVIMRDKIGSFMTKDNVAKFLNTWISDYILLNDEAPQSVKAAFPLREARVDVAEVPGKPGVYKAVVFLKPHFQLDELSVSIRLVAELPPPATA